MEPQTSGPEQRLTQIEAQIERLNLVLQQWHEGQDHAPPVEGRLAQLAEQYADLLKQWQAAGGRHAHAIDELEARLTGWNDVEARLQREAAGRFQSLERVIEQEWSALRHLHEEPTRQLRAHAESLAEISAATAGSAQTGLERAEARLSMLERDLHRRIDELSHEFRGLTAELKHRGEATGHRAATPWSFDDVTRLHQELRGAEANQNVLDTEASPPHIDVVAETSSPARPLLLASHDERRHQSGGATEIEAERDDDTDTPPRRWSATVVGLVVALLFTATFAVLFYQQASTAAARADDAKQRADQLTAAAAQRLETAQADASARIKQATDTAAKAQVTSEVLAAPDLIRFNLTGGDTSGRYAGQLLWSRSRGMVFSASRLPTPSPGTTYQVWLLTGEQPVSAGTFVPDTSGRVSTAVQDIPSIPRAVTGASVTLEPAPGRRTPSGAIVLARAK